MKRDQLRLSAHQTVETSRDFNGRFFVAYSSGASVFVRDPKELRRFLNITKAIPMRQALDSWLASLADQDAAKDAPVQEHPGDANVEGSFDPLAHQDDDPTAQTRMIT